MPGQTWISLNSHPLEPISPRRRNDGFLIQERYPNGGAGPVRSAPNLDSKGDFTFGRSALCLDPPIFGLPNRYWSGMEAFDGKRDP